MMKRLNKVLEVISPGVLDTLKKYSKSTPDFMMDKLISNLKNNGVDVKFDSDKENYYLTLSNKNGNIKKVAISKEDIVSGEVDIDSIMGMFNG